MNKAHYSWAICGGCTLLLFCTVGLTTSAFAVYQPYLVQAGELRNAQGSVVVTVRSLFALLSLLPAGRIYGRLGLRLGMTLACLSAALSFLCYGLLPSLPGYCLAAACSGLAYGLGGMMPVSIMMDRWFLSHKGTALGICAAGTGVAAVVVPPMALTLISRVSLRATFLTEAAFIAVVSITAFFLLCDCPANKGMTPFLLSGMQPTLSAPREESGASKRAICAMFFTLVLIGGVSSPGFSHASILYRAEGFDSVFAALLISLIGVTLFIGKFLYGRLTDKIGVYRAGLLGLCFLIAGMLLCGLARWHSTPLAILSTLMLGLGLPLSTIGPSIFAKNMADAAVYEKTVRLFQGAFMLGGLTFGPIPGLVADGTGSYAPAYQLFGAVAVLAALLFRLIYKRLYPPAAD